MKKFEFRLQKVLEYREAMEEWARDAYMESRIARMEAEGEIEKIQHRRSTFLKGGATSLLERLSLEATVNIMDDDERAANTVVNVLTGEEEKALEAWREKKRELEALIKLRDKAKTDYDLEATRYEQAELDEWAVLRRTA